MGLDRNLMKVAAYASHARQKGSLSFGKLAFQPPPPPDPAAGGGAPPPGGPPMDPMAGGGAPPPPGGPPMDPSMGGGMPPGGGAPMPPPPGPSADMGGAGGPDIAGAVQKAVSDAMTQMGMKGNMGPNGKPTAPKPDINTIATDVFQLKKMFLHYLRTQQIELPPDILDGPNRDPMTGAPAASPSGGSDVQPGASAQGQSLNGGAPSAIKPIEPMQGAFPSPGGAGGPPGGGGGGMPKAGGWQEALPVGQVTNFSRVRSKMAAVAQMCRQRNS